MTKIERRITTQAGPAKLETRVEGEDPVIVGTGAVFYGGTPESEYVLWDYKFERAVERIMPGAFAGCLTRPDDVRGLFNHDANCVLGRTASGTMKLSADGKGLHYEITPGDTTIAKDVKTHLSRKDVTGSSISFIVEEERWTETKDKDGKWHAVREILGIKPLFDTGPVTFPAYVTTTAGVRSHDEPDEAKKSLDAFRESRKDEPEPAVKARAAAYAARAHACEVSA